MIIQHQGKSVNFFGIEDGFILDVVYHNICFYGLCYEVKISSRELLLAGGCEFLIKIDETKVVCEEYLLE